MVGVHRVLVLLSALLIASTRAVDTDMTPAPPRGSDAATPDLNKGTDTPGGAAGGGIQGPVIVSPTPPGTAATPAISTATITPAPPSDGKMLIADSYCSEAVFEVFDNQFKLSCGTLPAGFAPFFKFADFATDLVLKVQGARLRMQTLDRGKLKSLGIHGDPPKDPMNNKPITQDVQINDASLKSLASLATLGKLSFDHVKFDNPEVVVIPNSVMELKITSTNAKGISLIDPQNSQNSKLEQVEIVGNPDMTTIPKLLYMQKFNSPLKVILALANYSNTSVELSQEQKAILEKNINFANSSFTIDGKACETKSTQLCTLVLENPPPTPTPVPTDNAAGNANIPSVTTQPSPAASTESGSSSSTITIVAIVLVVAAVGAIIGGVFYRRMRHKKSSSNGRTHRSNDHAVNLIGKDDAATNSNMLSFISGDETLRGMRLQQHEVALTKAIGSGRLWLGEYAGAKVVIKRIEAETTDPYATKNLSHQAQSLATLSHPNIVALVGVTWLAGTDFAVVAEFIDKSNLKQVLADANWQLDLQTKLRMCIDMAQAFAYLHATNRGMCMRNFSSRKVLVNSSSECKLNVFDVFPTTTKLELPVIESFGVGEIAWLAPELVTRSSPQDPRKINMFALGVVLCEVLTRASPYEALAADQGNMLSDMTIVRRIKHREVLAPQEDSVEFMRAPKSLRDMIARCLVHTPLDRPTADDMLVALEAAQSELSATRVLL